MSQSPVKTHAPLVTGFGSAALSRALVEQLRTKGARQAIILTPLAARVPDLTALLEAEGLGQARILTFTQYALELAGHPGAVAVTRPQKWFLFRKAFSDSPSGVREAFARESQAMEALFHLLDSLRANRVRGLDLEGLQNSHPGAGALAAFLR